MLPVALALLDASLLIVKASQLTLYFPTLYTGVAGFTVGLGTGLFAVATTPTYVQYSSETLIQPAPDFSLPQQLFLISVIVYSPRSRIVLTTFELTVASDLI